MLARNPSERPTFEQILDHVWVITAVKSMDLTDPKMHKAITTSTKTVSLTKQSIPSSSSEDYGHRRIPELPPISSRSGTPCSTRSVTSTRSATLPRTPSKKMSSHGRSSSTKGLHRPSSMQSTSSLQFKSSGVKFDLRHQQPEMVI
jgi:hypothetical protein